MVRKRNDGWLIASLVMAFLFFAVLIYPLFGLMKQAVIMPDGRFSFEQFRHFFEHRYYTATIWNTYSTGFGAPSCCSSSASCAACPPRSWARIPGSCCWAGAE